MRSRVARLSRQVPPVAIAYAAPSLIAAIAVQTWFRGDAGLATGDLAPPVAPGIDYRAHWNGFDSGAGAPSYQIVSLPYFEGLRLFSALGFGEVAFQRLWLTVLVAASAASVVFLARGLVRSPLAAAVAGLVPLFSAYRLTLAFDPVPLVAMIAAAVLGGLVIRAGGDSGPRPLVFGLASLSCGYVALNPPHVALVLAWIAVCVLLAWAAHGREAPRRVARFLRVGVPLALLFNLWWIVPAILAFTGPVFTDRFAAAGVDEWAWTHVRGSVLNVVTFTSHWAWPYPEYFPFSARLERPPYSLLQYVPALAAVGGVALAAGRQRRVGLILLVVGVVAIWVMKGLHDPLGGINRWLYDAVPGFWLLRDPAKAGLVLALVFALLIAIGIAALAERSRRAGTAAAVFVVAAAALYAHPLLTGAVVPSERPLLPSAHVRVPAGWEATAAYLESRPANGKVVVLPRLDYYQTPTTWGYYGASFLHSLIDRPVIEPVPAAYYRDAEVDALVGRLQAEILRGAGDVKGLLQALGARYIVLRRDLDTAFPGRSLASPDLLAKRLAGAQGIRHLRGFGEADVYEAPGVRMPEVYPALPVIEDEGSLSAVRRAVAVPRRAAVVRPEAGDALGRCPQGAGAGGDAQAKAGRQSRVRRSRRAAATPDGRRGAASGPAAGSRSAVRRPRRPPAPRGLGHRRTPRGGSLSCVLQSWRRVAATSRRSVSSSVSRWRTASATATGMTIAPAGRSASPRAPPAVTSARRCGWPRATIRPALRSRWSRHGRASRCVSRCRIGGWPAARLGSASGRRAPIGAPTTPALDPSPGWHRFDETIRLAPRTESVHVFLYADGVAGGRGVTRTEYRGLTVSSPASDIGVMVQPPARLPQVSYRRTGPDEFRVRVVGAERPFVLVAAETFAPGWRLEREDARAVEHFKVNGYANGWRVPWTGSYELTISYRPERVAQAARRLDLIAVPIGVLALVLGPIRRRRRSG